MKTRPCRGSRLFRIAHVTTDLGLAGRERVVVELANQQSKNGYDVSIICLKKEGKLKDRLDPSIDVFTCWKGAGIELATFRKMVSFLKRKKPQIVHTHNPGTLLYGNIASRLAGIPYIVNTEHGFSEPSSFRGRLKEAILYRFTHKVTVVSENLKGRIQKTYWAPEGKLAVIPNGISIPKPSKSPDEVRMEIGMSKRHTNIVIVGRLSPVKNHQMLLKAFSLASEENENLRLWVIGVGPLRILLDKFCDELGIVGKVHFLGLRDDVPDIMSAMDMLVLCSISEGMPITIIEAMALELPIIATNVGGNAELIENGMTGFLIELNNISKLKKVISCLSKNYELRNKFKTNAKLYFNKYLSVNKLFYNFSNEYEGFFLKKNNEC
jgi:glycosyltransferase involved in cell wall biosynthesis